MTEADACRFLRKTHQTIRMWRRRYERGGLNELLERNKEGTGRKAKITDKVRIEKAIEKLSTEIKGRRVYLKDLVEYFSKNYDSHYTVSGMRDLLKRNGNQSRSTSLTQNPQLIKQFQKKISYRK